MQPKVSQDTQLRKVHTAHAQERLRKAWCSAPTAPDLRDRSSQADLSPQPMRRPKPSCSAAAKVYEHSEVLLSLADFVQSPYDRGGLCFGGRQPPSLFASKPGGAQESPCRDAQEIPASPGIHVSLLWKPGYRKNGTSVPLPLARSQNTTETRC